MASISERLLSALGGSYTIERELTGGGMAQVFVAEDHDLARKVVIKILPPELAASVSAERFRREILTVWIHNTEARSCELFSFQARSFHTRIPRTVNRAPPNAPRRAPS